MASIVDALIITLGLDASKFNVEQKKAVESLKKFDEQAQKSNKSVNTGTKELGDSFGKTLGALSKLGAAYLSFDAVKGFIGGMTSANTELGQNAHLLGFNARELKTWGDTLATVGGNADDFTNAMMAMKQGMANIRKNDVSFLKNASPLGQDFLEIFDTTTGAINVKKLADAFKELVKNQGESFSLGVANSMGISQSMFLVLEKGGDSVQSLYDGFDKLNKDIGENSRTAAELTAKWGDSKKILESYANEAVKPLTDDLISLLDVLNKIAAFSQSDIFKIFGYFGTAKDFIVDKMGESIANLSGISFSDIAKAKESIANKKKADLHGVNPALQSAVDALGATVISGYRDKAAWQKMWDSGYDRNGQHYTKEGHPMGTYEGSHHSTGNAVDIDMAQARGMSDSLLAKYGLYRPFKDLKEINHLELLKNSGSMLGASNQVGASPISSSNTSTVHIQNQNIHTMATDAHGVIESFDREMQNNILTTSGIRATN